MTSAKRKTAAGARGGLQDSSYSQSMKIYNPDSHSTIGFSVCTHE